MECVSSPDLSSRWKCPFRARKSEGWGPKRGGVLLNKKSALSLLHPDAGTAAILWDELDAGLFQRGADRIPNIL